MNVNGTAIKHLIPSALILTLPLAITIRYGVVARFGDAYRAYKARARR
jgi:hypothetical protein